MQCYLINIDLIISEKVGSEQKSISPPSEYVSLELIKSISVTSNESSNSSFLSISVSRKDNDIIVLDQKNKELVIVDINGRILARWGGEGKEPGKFIHPQAFAINSRDEIYVCDAVKWKMLIFPSLWSKNR